MVRPRSPLTAVAGTPPSFLEAHNRRQKARAAGLHPDYWYAVEYERALQPGQVREVTFWNTSIAVYRSTDGRVTALENRCAHRQVKLSLGQVQECRLVCPYHGWAYDDRGQVVDIPHELFGRPMPSFRVRSYPVQVRYGLIWIFPGDPALAAQRHPPRDPGTAGPTALGLCPTRLYLARPSLHDYRQRQ